MRNRTIPMTTKEEAEIQTDVNLINQNQMEEVRRSSEQREIRFSQIVSESVLLKSFSTNQVFQELSHLIGDLRNQGVGNEDIEKRLSLIQKEIQGLMKRDLLISQTGQKGPQTTDYYSIINQLQKQKIRLEYQLSYNGIKTQRYERKIEELEKQITALRETVGLAKNTLIENQVYRDFVTSLKEEKRIDSKRLGDLQSQLMIKGVNVDEDKSQGKRINVGGNDDKAGELWAYFANQIEGFQHQGRLSMDNLNKELFALYQMSSPNILDKDLSTSFSFKSKYEDLQSKYQDLRSVFAHQVETIVKDNPSIKGLKSLQELVALTDVNESELELINIEGWVGIGKLTQGAGYYVENEDGKEGEERKMLAQLATQLKLIIDKYPKVASQLTKQTTFLLQHNSLLQQLITTSSFSRVKQIVTYQPEIVRVDNVYQFSNKKDQQLVFNLRVLIKALLEELETIRKKYNVEVTLDAGLLEMMRGQVIQGVDVEDILALYRPLPKIIEIEKLVQKPIYITNSLQKSLPIFTQRPILAQSTTQKAIQITKQVPIYIQSVINNPINQYIEVQLQREKIIQVPTIREVIVEKVVVNQKLNDVEVERIVPVYEEKIVQVYNNREVVVQRTKIVEIEKPVQVPGPKEYVQIEKIVQKPIYLKDIRQRVRQIEVINEKIFQRDRYIEIQRQVPHIITNRQTVYLDRQVPRFITNTEQKEVNVTEVIEKIVPLKVVEEKVVEVPVVREKEIVKEVEKEVLVEVTHFVKGNKQEVIKQVEIIVEKPIREEFLITKQLQVQKVIPLYYKQEKPVYFQMQMPYIQSQPKIINQQVARIVPLREQIIKEVRVQVPVPVIVQKQVIRIETVFVDKIVQKIVEVPRIVEIQKIVQKIVPVPRIIEKIVQVPRIIQKIVTVQVPCLQIVEVFRQIPVIKEVEVIKQVIIQKPVIEYVKEIEIVERQKIVEIVVEKQVPKEVLVQRRIPTEVVREVPVQVYRDRIVQRIVQIHQVTVKDRQVMVPFTHQVPVRVIVQKPVITQKLIETIIKVPQVIQKQKPIIQTITIPEIVEVRIQKPIEIEVVREIPGPETIKYIEVPKEVEVLREKVVRVENTVQVPKQVYLMVDNIVHNVHSQSYPIHVPTFIQQPYLVQVNTPTHIIHYKQVPIQVQTTRNIPVRSIINQIKQVEKQVHHQCEVEIIKQKIKEIVNETRRFVEKEVPKEMLREVVVNETKVEVFEVPGETKLVQHSNTITQPQPTTNYIEKVVERIIMLPQIVEVVKHLHSISQLQSPGVAVNTTVQQHTKEFVSVSTELHTALGDLLQKFRENVYRLPDLKVVIPVIERHLKKVEEWVRLPKIVEVQRVVEKVVQKDKVVLVPSTDHQKQASLSYLVQKLVLELRRIKQRNRIQLLLQQDIQRLFFKDTKSQLLSQKKVDQFNELLKQKYSSLGGEWRESYPFMIDSFLQDYFTLNSTISQLSHANDNLQEKVKLAQSQLDANQKEIIAIQSQNSQLLRNYDGLLDALRGVTDKGMGKRQVQNILKEYGLTKQEEKRLSRVSQSEGKLSKRGSSSISPLKIEEGAQSSARQISNLISKTSKLEAENMELNGKIKNYERQINLLENEIEKYKAQLQKSQRMSQIQPQASSSSIKAIEQIKTRLVNENEQKIKRLQESQNQQITRLKTAQEKQLQRLKAAQQKEIQRIKDQKISASNSQLLNENRRLAEQLRNVKRELEVEKRSVEVLRQQHQRQIENLKKQYELNLQKKDSNISSIETVKARISEDYEQKINELRGFYEKQLERLKTVSSMRKQQAVMEDIGEKQTTELKDRVKRLEIELESNRKQLTAFQQQKSKLTSTTAYTGSVFTSAVKQPIDVVAERRQLITQGFTAQRTKLTSIQTYQSAMQRKFVSPSSVKSRQEDGSSLRSSSSRKSGMVSKFKSQMTLREFMDMESKEDRDMCSTFIMIKIIEKIEEEAKYGILHSFSPSNIYLINLNPRNNFESLTIKFGAPIANKNNKNDGLYLAPQILAGQKPTQKSIVFTLAVIWDELIHGQLYFKSMKDIESPQVEFKVRDAKLNPILKNTLFEMMNKDQVKRLQLHETKRRLSLQKYIASESKR